MVSRRPPAECVPPGSGQSDASTRYRSLLAQNGFQGFISRSGKLCDSVQAERLIETLKVETVCLMACEAFEDVCDDLPRIIGIHSTGTLHSALHHLNPAQSGSIIMAPLSKSRSEPVHSKGRTPRDVQFPGCC